MMVTFMCPTYSTIDSTPLSRSSHSQGEKDVLPKQGTSLSSTVTVHVQTKPLLPFIARVVE